MDQSGHGSALGVVIEGCPPGLLLDLEAVQAELDRRRPGQSLLTTQRRETNQIKILSGLFEGRTLGTALALMIRNKDAKPDAYAPFKDRYRPSHADFTYDARYGLRAWAGGGRASARETAARVAAGAVARQVLQTLGSVEVVAWVDQVQGLVATVARVSLGGVEMKEGRNVVEMGQQVLDKVAELSNWGAAPAGRFQGIAVHESFESVAAEVVIAPSLVNVSSYNKSARGGCCSTSSSTSV